MTETQIKPLTIAVDLDGTTADYEHALRVSIGRFMDIPEELLYEHFPAVTDYAMGNNGWHQMDSAEKFIALHSRAVEEGLFEQMEPYEGASDTLWDFHAQGHFIRIVTARFLKPGDRYQVGASTFRFLDKHNIPVDDIAFTARKTEVIADVYIDDAPKNILELTAAGRTVIIYDQAYNRDLPGLRAHNWADVKRIINELATQ